jgi:hypothetical protein
MHPRVIAHGTLSPAIPLAGCKPDPPGRLEACAMYAAPLSSKEVRAYTDGRLKWVIDYGIRPSGVPGSKDVLSSDEICSIVAFLRYLLSAGILGEPEMYSH